MLSRARLIDNSARSPLSFSMCQYTTLLRRKLSLNVLLLLLNLNCQNERVEVSSIRLSSLLPSGGTTLNFHFLAHESSVLAMNDEFTITDA